MEKEGIYTLIAGNCHVHGQPEFQIVVSNVVSVRQVNRMRIRETTRIAQKSIVGITCTSPSFAFAM
jgi:hypothetical protein